MPVLSRLFDSGTGVKGAGRSGCQLLSLSFGLHPGRASGFTGLCAEKNILVKLIVNAENHSYAYLLEPSLIRNGSRFYIGNPDSDTLFAMNPDRTLEPLLVRTPSHSEEGNKYGLFLRGAAGGLFLSD